MTEYSEYKIDYQVFPGIPLEDACPKMENLGIDLLKELLVYQPEKRISAEDALKRKIVSRWFDNNI